MEEAIAPDAFEIHRRFLTRLAYRMLGSVSDADDVVQEAWMRWHGAERAEIENPRAWLARTTTRLCLDQLKSARSRREFYVGAWLPEPLIATMGTQPEADDGIDAPMALMLALERLSPLERAAFLLHDIFEMDFAEIGRTIDRSEAACRQLAKRAREHVRVDMPPRRDKPDDAAVRRLVDAFFAAAHSADPTELKRLLAQDIVLYGDGGGRVMAVLNPVFGSDRVSRFFAGITHKFTDPAEPAAIYRPALINGMPGYVSLEGGQVLQATALDIRDGLVHAIYAIRNPDKLRNVAPPLAED